MRALTAKKKKKEKKEIKTLQTSILKNCKGLLLHMHVHEISITTKIASKIHNPKLQRKR